MAIKIGKLFGTDKLVGTDDDDLLVALGAKTTLDGGAGNDILLGGWNNDILIGGAGADFLFGGFGTDTADYSTSDAGVIVNLTTGKGSGGDAEGDTLLSIENVVGSAHDDVLTGDAGNNVLTGGEGSDVFVLTKGKDVITDFSPGGGSGAPLLIDFEGIPSAGYIPGLAVPASYFGFSWSSLYAFEPIFLGSPSGYEYSLVSGNNVGFKYGAGPGTFSSSAGDFEFRSVYLSSIAAGQYTVEAWDDGALVGTATLDLADYTRSYVNFQASSATNASSAAFTGRFDSIDEVRVHGSSFHVLLDDLLVAMEGGGDKIDVPDGTDIAALVASAVSDGHGGTLLKYQGGQLDLQGVDPGSVKADWFV